MRYFYSSYIYISCNFILFTLRKSSVLLDVEKMENASSQRVLLLDMLTKYCSYIVQMLVNEGFILILKYSHDGTLTSVG